MKVSYDNKNVWFSAEDNIDEKALEHLSKDKLVFLNGLRIKKKLVQVTFRRV